MRKKPGAKKATDGGAPDEVSSEGTLSGGALNEVANAFAGLGDPGGLYSYPGSFFSNYGLNWSKNVTIPTLPGTSKLSTPKPDDYKTQMIWAREIRDVKLVRGPLLRRKEFIVSGFRHRHRDQRVVELFDEIAKESKLKKALKDIAWELSTVGWVVAMPDQINEIPQAIHLLQDGIENERVFGVDNVGLRIDSIVAQKIAANSQNFPDYITNQVSSEDFNGKISLDNCYFLSAPRSINAPFPRSPIFPLFEPIKVIENLVETQFAISFAIKQLIMHVKVSGQEGPDGVKKPTTMAQLKNAARQVFDGAKTATIVTPDTVTIEYLSPDKSIFDAANTPYQRAMERINKNIGIPMILVDGDAQGVSFSTAVYIIKGFLQAVINEREVLLDDFVYPWYQKKAMDLYSSDPKKYSFLFDKKRQKITIPEVIFNETELKNMLEMLQILRFKWQTGMYSGQEIVEAFQDDYDTIKNRKEGFNGDCDWVYLPFEPNQGLARNVEGIETQVDPRLIAPDGEPINQVDIMDLTHEQQLEIMDEQHKDSLEIQGNQHENEIKMQKAAHKNSAAGNPPQSPPIPGSTKVLRPPKPKGGPGRPPSMSGQPSPDQVDRPPRSGSGGPSGASPVPRQQSLGKNESELTISDIMDMLDRIDQRALEVSELLSKKNEKDSE